MNSGPPESVVDFAQVLTTVIKWADSLAIISKN